MADPHPHKKHLVGWLYRYEGKGGPAQAGGRRWVGLNRIGVRQSRQGNKGARAGGQGDFCALGQRIEVYKQTIDFPYPHNLWYYPFPCAGYPINSQLEAPAPISPTFSLPGPVRPTRSIPSRSQIKTHNPSLNTRKMEIPQPSFPTHSPSPFPNPKSTRRNQAEPKQKPASPSQRFRNTLTFGVWEPRSADHRTPGV